MNNLSIAVNASNDIYLDANGNLAMATDETALLQDCEHALKAQLGEMFLNPGGGMPTLADVWRTRNFIKWEAAARSALIATNGVVKVASFTMATNRDGFSYTAEILTAYSPTSLVVTGNIGQPQ